MRVSKEDGNERAQSSRKESRVPNEAPVTAREWPADSEEPGDNSL
jgi:hypothetical protein